MTTPIQLGELGGWLVYPVAGTRAGEGGDCYEVVYFGDRELDALRYANRHDGFRAVYAQPGQSLLQAVDAMEAAAHD
ncbi:hypothetical protein [Nocardia ignorata]|uniref:Uncharacterized protein n=1 Tax=Nocardia ignorata TaxID=145285 RepID=A0A4R6NZY2_NOCIG|nr:hypothetical protein [Nocardia ignorata]TDP29898.1 hypothetical protein DFR75_112167 [Nocardia ignorata]